MPTTAETQKKSELPLDQAADTPANWDAAGPPKLKNVLSFPLWMFCFLGQYFCLVLD
jgi:hypothetical protein